MSHHVTSLRTGHAIAAGAIGTGVITALWLVEPSVGLPKIAVGQILGSLMSVTVAQLNFGPAAGWLIHLVIGILLALIYAWLFAWRLTGRRSHAAQCMGCWCSSPCSSCSHHWWERDSFPAATSHCCSEAWQAISCTASSSPGSTISPMANVGPAIPRRPAESYGSKPISYP